MKSYSKTLDDFHPTNDFDLLIIDQIPSAAMKDSIWTHKKRKPKHSTVLEIRRIEDEMRKKKQSKNQRTNVYIQFNAVVVWLQHKDFLFDLF